MPPLPDPVRQVTGTFLSLVDEAAPGLVEGLYLHGSLGFGEWHDGRSDVDFVAVTARRPDPGTTALMRNAHAHVTETFPRPAFDGVFLTPADLARSPYDCPDVPCVLRGSWQDAGRFEVNPVTWHELAWHGLAVRGPDPADVWTDPAALWEYSRRNLDEYWAPLVDDLVAHPDEGARPDLVEWFVLGIPRLHHLLATGRLTSKDGAGAHALEVFGGRWRPVIAEALTHRAIGEESGAWRGREEELAADVLAFSRLALDESRALPPRA
ncbi:MAG: DUF4111 domain-containing protein [Nocardioidaceae bacterium]|nr:DUF4111 domain-containing protein [Nocardioidaceae bacterium]NUS49539.1 DUF4111 domain-containing protein [Nocardioidaceae bacterium]